MIGALARYAAHLENVLLRQRPTRRISWGGRRCGAVRSRGGAVHHLPLGAVAADAERQPTQSSGSEGYSEATLKLAGTGT